MAGDVWRERIAPKGLADSLCATAADSSSQFAVGDGSAARDLEKGEVHFALKGCDGNILQHALTNIGEILHFDSLCLAI